MRNTDMIVWQAKGASSTSTDYWSTGNNTPMRDTVQNLLTTFVQNANNTVSFQTVRDLDTKDA